MRVDVYNGNRLTMSYGNSVRIDHGNGYTTVYAHFSKTFAKLGETVAAGQVIGLAGNTGNSYGPHLHFTLKKAGATERGETRFPRDIVDPAPFLERAADPPK